MQLKVNFAGKNRDYHFKIIKWFYQKKWNNFLKSTLSNEILCQNNALGKPKSGIRDLMRGTWIGLLLYLSLTFMKPYTEDLRFLPSYLTHMVNL